MALTAGSVTVDPDTGDVTGTGIAYALMLGRVAFLDASEADFIDGGGEPLTMARRIALLNFYKAEVEAAAAALVPELGAAEVRVPADAIDSGIPSIERVLTGAME